MDKFPLTADGRPAGELIAQREGLYTWFSARCPLPEEFQAQLDKLSRQGGTI